MSDDETTLHHFCLRIPEGWDEQLIALAHKRSLERGRELTEGDVLAESVGESLNGTGKSDEVWVVLEKPYGDGSGDARVIGAFASDTEAEACVGRLHLAQGAGHQPLEIIRCPLGVEDVEIEKIEKSV